MTKRIIKLLYIYIFPFTLIPYFVHTLEEDFLQC